MCEDVSEVIYDNFEEDIRLTQTQADLTKAMLEYISNPNYFKPPYRVVESWKYTKARKEHIDAFGNKIKSGEYYLASKGFYPTRLSYKSLYGMWLVLICEGVWKNILKKWTEERGSVIASEHQKVIERVEQALDV